MLPRNASRSSSKLTAAFASASSRPCAGSAGVVDALNSRIAPSSASTGQSVNVPPTSIETRLTTARLRFDWTSRQFLRRIGSRRSPMLIVSLSPRRSRNVRHCSRRGPAARPWPAGRPAPNGAFEGGGRWDVRTTAAPREGPSGSAPAHAHFPPVRISHERQSTPAQPLQLWPSSASSLHRGPNDPRGSPRRRYARSRATSNTNADHVHTRIRMC